MTTEKGHSLTAARRCLASSSGRTAIICLLDGGAELATPVIRSRPLRTGYVLEHQP